MLMQQWYINWKYQLKSFVHPPNNKRVKNKQTNQTKYGLKLNISIFKEETKKNKTNHMYRHVTSKSTLPKAKKK